MTKLISEISLVTLKEFEEAYKELTSDEEARAEILLLQISNYLRQIAYNNGQDIDENIEADPTGVYKSNVKMVITAATQRMIAAPASIIPDATQWSQSATPYTESVSFGTGGSGSVYFQNKELKLLGLTSVSGRPNVSILRGVR